jgi:predicted permease
MQNLWNNIRYAFRQLRRSPGFTITVVLTLALGVGANAVVFSVLNALILRPLALPQAEQLQFFNRVGATTGDSSSSPAESYPDYRDLRDGNHSFSGLAAYRFERAGVGTAGAVYQSWDIETSENYFDVLGVQPALGRFFHASDAHGPNSMPYIVLSYAYWHARFNGDPSIVGRTVEVNKHPMTVLGVAPRTFTGTELFFAPDLWAPLLDQEQLDGMSNLESRGDHNTWVLGRLRPGVSTQHAEADLNTIGRRLSAQYKEDDGLAFRLSRPGLIGDFLGRPVRAFLFGVTALAALVLLAACANLGSLFAARASDRAREFAVRLALGASRMVLVRQLLVEAIAVSLVGGVVGLVLATGALRALSLWRPSPDFPVQVSVHADARVAALALALALASGIFFGLVPARQIWNGSAYMIIKSGAAGGEVVGRRRWMNWNLRDLLLVVQIILCSVLVTSALVAARGLSRSLHTSFGFEPEGVTLAAFDLRMVGKNEEQSLAFQHRAIDAVSALPGVTAVAFSNTTPLSLSSSDTDVYRDGTTDFRPSNAAADASYFDVSPGYFRTARTTLLAGREFTWQDDKQAPRVIAVNQTFARQVFGTTVPADAVGRYFITGSKRRWQVVAVVEDGKYQSLTEDQKAAIFFPSAQGPDTDTVLLVRSANDRATTAAAIHQALVNLEPSVPVVITPWPQALGMVLFPSIAASAALGVMGALAAMLAITGIFGMASYSVSKRLRELGIRVALGAQRREVLSAALGRPARLLVFGSVIGLGLGAAASKLLAHIVYQASSQDPVVLLGVIATMALIALLASWLPARRALSIDPATLLREE